MIKENDKKYLLPSDYENKYNMHSRRERAKSSLNTAQRVFTHTNENNLLTDNEMIETSPKKTNSNFFSHRPQDSMSNLISYKYAPNFREIVNLILFKVLFLKEYTGKVNTPNYKTANNTINSYEILSTKNSKRNMRTFSNLKTQDLMDSRNDFKQLYTSTNKIY